MGINFDLKETMLVIGAVTLGIIAALAGKWEIAGMVITGAFAILRGAKTQ